MSKLIYIISMGHSGSTLTDMWLGTIPGVFSTGEVIHLPRQIFRKVNPEDIQTYCSCGEGFESCSFWKKVFNNLHHKTGIDVFKHPKKFDISIHSSFLKNRTKLDAFRHRVLLSIHRYAGQSWLWNQISAYYYKSIEKNWMLYDTITEESGCKYIVDSSKNFLRYVFLKKHRPKDIKLILLIRNIHGVASSSHHGLNEGIIKTRANEWNKLYSRLARYLKHLDKGEYYILNYDNLCSNPIRERERIARFIGIDEKLPDYCSINTKEYHLVAGNPIRHQGHVSIRYDERWKKRLTKEQIQSLNHIQAKVVHQLKSEKLFH